MGRRTGGGQSGNWPLEFLLYAAKKKNKHRNPLPQMCVHLPAQPCTLIAQGLHVQRPHCEHQEIYFRSGQHR